MSDPKYGERSPEINSADVMRKLVRDLSDKELDAVLKQAGQDLEGSPRRQQRPGRAAEIFGLITAFSLVGLVIVPLGIFLIRFALGDL